LQVERERLKAVEAERVEAERVRLRVEAERLSYVHGDADGFEADGRVGARLVVDGRTLVERVELPWRTVAGRSVWPI
jgi:hypothetical protein